MRVVFRNVLRYGIIEFDKIMGYLPGMNEAEPYGKKEHRSKLSFQDKLIFDMLSKSE